MAQPPTSFNVAQFEGSKGQSTYGPGEVWEWLPYPVCRIVQLLANENHSIWERLQTGIEIQFINPPTIENTKTYIYMYIYIINHCSLEITIPSFI